MRLNWHFSHFDVRRNSVTLTDTSKCDITKLVAVNLLFIFIVVKMSSNGAENRTEVALKCLTDIPVTWTHQNRLLKPERKNLLFFFSFKLSFRPVSVNIILGLGSAVFFCTTSTVFLGCCQPPRSRGNWNNKRTGELWHSWAPGYFENSESKQAEQNARSLAENTIQPNTT